MALALASPSQSANQALLEMTVPDGSIGTSIRSPAIALSP
jgi:hypothetical protein